MLAVIFAFFACAHAFPSYVPCANDAETMLKVGTHTCAVTNKFKGSDIQRAPAGQGELKAKKKSIIRGETLSIELDTARLNWVLQEGIWMTIRVSDAGAHGNLIGDRDIFQARCPTQMSTMAPIKKHLTKMAYRAPCDAEGNITLTLVFSRCLFGCSQGFLDSGAIQPKQLYLTDITLPVTPGALDPSCGQATPPPPMPKLQDICKTTQCWEGGCEGKALPGLEVAEVPVKSLPVQVSKWDRDAKRYGAPVSVGAHVIQDSRWGAMSHGARTLRGQGDKAAPGEPITPLYVSDINNQIWRLDNITLGGTAQSQLAAWVVSPAHQHHFYDEDAGKLRGMVVASAQPFGVSPGDQGAVEITQGGMYAISPTSGCHKLWPNEIDEPQHQGSGAVVNAVTCHEPSGVCFFNNWEHLFDEKSEFSHCLHWCAVDDPTDPTKCTAGEPLAGGPNDTVIPGRFCAEPHMGNDGKKLYVATNGILITDAHLDGDTWHLETLISWTDGKSGMETGISFARKVMVDVKRAGQKGDATTVKAMSYEFFGSDLWKDTVEGTDRDVRLDHMWRDAAGYIWFSTFSKKHGGEHVLDYKTGHLLYSYTGFGKVSPVGSLLPFNPSGISIIGGFGQEGSLALVTVEAVPPLPFFKGALYLVDISHIPEMHTETII